jgi:hypothetical protein
LLQSAATDENDWCRKICVLYRASDYKNLLFERSIKLDKYGNEKKFNRWRVARRK